MKTFVFKFDTLNTRLPDKWSMWERQGISNQASEIQITKSSRSEEEHTLIQTGCNG